VLNNSNSRKINRSIVEDKENNLVFMFSGIGSQYLTMGKDLYRDNMFFKETLDSCFELFDKKNRYKVNYAKLLFSDNTPLEILNDFRNSQIIIFCFEYSLVKLLTNIGIKPSAVIGYSFGEYVAACISGIFSLDDAIDIIIRRGELIQTLDQGSMLSIPMPFIEIEKWLNDDLFLSINNGDSCVVSGSVSCINTLQNKLKEQRVLTQKLDTSYAIHSKLMNPILDDFIEILSKVKLNEPNIPFISSITGTWITDDQAKDPKYWCHHLVKTVEFSKGLDTLEILENKICIEIGPGNDLVQLLNRKLGKNNKTKVLNIIKPSNSNLTDVKNFMSKIGELWSYGENILWERFYNEKCQKLSLPSAPFIKQKYSIIQGKKKKSNKSKSKWFFGKTDNICDWYYSKSWERTNLISCSIDSDKTWLIFTNNTNLSKTIVNEFISRNINIITVFPGKEYRQITDTCFSVRIGEKQDYLKLITDMEYKIIPSNILHLWNLENKHSEINSESLNIDASFYSLIYLMQALGDLGINDDILLKIVSNNIHNVIGDDLFFPQKSTLLGPAKIIPLEYKNAECVSIDIDIRYLELDNNSFFLQMLLDEIFTISDDVVVSLRGRYRWIPSIKKEKLLQKHNTGEILKEKGVYLITGGFGGMGYSLAEFLAENYNSNIIMFGRTEIPDRQEWDKYINRIPHDKVTDRILKIKKIESYGTRITPICVDISNPQNLKKALSTCTLNNGKINGIFHTAGVAEYDGFIQNKSKDNIQKILDPKIMGTVLLKEFSNDLDFYFICSSIASVIYHTKMGQVAYCAAHEFIDSYVDYLSVNTNINIFSVNWSDWKNVGMSVESAKHWGEKLQLQNSQAILDEGILPSEGLTVIHEVINNSIKQVMISPEDLIDKITIYNQNKSNMLEQILLEASVNTEIYERPKLTSEYKAPTDNIEIVLCNIWETIFGIKSIGVFDDFYELGGDSLKAITVISKIHEKLNARLSLKEFYIAANILGIKDKISKMDSSNFLKLEIVEKAPNYKLSSAQKRMYLLNSFEPTELKYNMLLSWKLIGQLDINRLKYAINSVIDRHESLRTLFLFDDENPKQIIKSNVTLEIDIRIIEDDLEKEIVNFRKPFILDEAPLMRVGLFKVSNEGNILLIDIHHIISDGISNNIIISDIAKFYNNSDIEPLEFKYKDYANWEQNYIESDIFKDDEEYWIKNLQDFKKVNFPLDNQRIRKTSEKGQSFKTTVDKEIAN
ncbi:MAG: KR domain-containing protein, partial [bacterium]|nr:KR domain-containing protein [bacterium]